jgi:hypothetical protein
MVTLREVLKQAETEGVAIGVMRGLRQSSLPKDRSRGSRDSVAFICVKR